MPHRVRWRLNTVRLTMLIVYNPKTQSFTPWGVPQSDLPVMETLLLNILIELQVMNSMLKDSDITLEPLETMRADAVGF